MSGLIELDSMERVKHLSEECLPDFWTTESITEIGYSPIETERRITFIDLPEEIIYLIFSFLSVEDLLKNVISVCKKFSSLLTECYFKRRLKVFLNIKEIPRSIKALGIDYGDQPLTWKYACFKYQMESEKWSRKYKDMLRCDFSNHTSSVDVAKILGDGKFLVSGGRDRVISLWDIENRPRLLGFNEREHSGWIWDVVPCDAETAFSCDWDGKIFKWSLADGLREPVGRFPTGKPVLCLCSVDNLLVAGFQTGEISLLDPRSSDAEIHTEKVQGSAVMGVDVIADLIVSISEDKTLSVFDIKNKHQIKKSRISSSRAIPVSMSRIDSALYIAQTDGSVSLVNTSTFKIWDVFSTVDSRLTSIDATNLGCVVTSSRDAHVTIYSPGKSLRTVRDLDMGAEVARVHYSRGILSIARADNKITIFNSNLSN